MEDLGIYTNIRESGNKSPWDGKHKMYYAECKICGKTVERTLYDLKHFNQRCQHGARVGGKAECHVPKGSVKTDYDKRVYDLWRHMIIRTTPRFWEKYPCYEGTTVSDEWKDFATFYEDIKSLKGYEMWAKGYGKRVMLDKDVLGNGRKHYSKETCCFLSHADSNRDVISRHPENLEKLWEGSKRYKEEISRKVKATNKRTGESRFFDSIKECAKELNVLQSNIWMCLSNDPKYISHKSSKGWTFEENN